MLHPINLDDIRAIQNCLVAKYLKHHDPDLAPRSAEDPYRSRQGLPTFSFERFEPFADYLLGLEVDVLAALRLCRWIGWVFVLPVSDERDLYRPGIPRLSLAEGRHRLIAITSLVFLPVPTDSPDTEKKLDGPFDADGFRYGGVEVRFGRLSSDSGWFWHFGTPRNAALAPLGRLRKC